jgi:hypothetical protein
MLASIVAAVAAILAWAAWARAGRVSRKLEALNQSYWELRYDFTRLRSQVARLDPAVPDEEDHAPAPAAAQTVAFVPLSSIRKKE